MADVGPSAQSVGREFVRQYYTMLNERPDCLHRFVYAGLCVGQSTITFCNPFATVCPKWNSREILVHEKCCVRAVS